MKRGEEMKTIIFPLQTSEKRASDASWLEVSKLSVEKELRAHGLTLPHPCTHVPVYRGEHQGQAVPPEKRGAQRALLGFSRCKDMNPVGFWKCGSQ